MTSLSRFFVIVFALFAASAGHAETADTQSTGNCEFWGEVLEVNGDPEITLMRVGEDEPMTDVGIGTRLRTGDKIKVTLSGNVHIIASPVELDYILTQSDKVFEINKERLCSGSANTPGWLAAIWQTVQRVVSEPVVDKPKTTLPKRSLFCGAYANNGTILDLEKHQFLVEGQDQIALHWLGMPAKIRVIANPNEQNELLLDMAPAKGELQAVSRLSRPLQAGDQLILELQTALGANRRMIQVVSADHLPFPDKLDADTVLSEEDWLSASNYASYAIWLATNAPEEWHLQGMNFLGDAASQNPVAHKVWRRLWSEQRCVDDF